MRQENCNQSSLGNVPESGRSLPEPFEKASWEIMECRKVSGIERDGRHLYIGRFLSGSVPRHGRCVVSVYFWAKHPRTGVKTLLEQGRCPTTFHNEVLN